MSLLSACWRTISPVFDGNFLCSLKSEYVRFKIGLLPGGQRPGTTAILRDACPCKGVIPTPMFEFFRRAGVVEHLFGDKTFVDRLYVSPRPV
jgi:hypothetical protein